MAAGARRVGRHRHAGHGRGWFGNHGRAIVPRDVGLELLENAAATAAALSVIIMVFGPVSGAHLNPVVSLADWALGRRSGTGLPGRDLAAYIPAQICGAVGGAALANLMFSLPALTISTKPHNGDGLWLGEAVATAGLITLIFALSRTGRNRLAPAAVGAYIGAAYWFTSSTSFANPAVTIGRAFSNTFAGIAPQSLPGFIVAQLAGALLGGGLVLLLYPAHHPRGRAAACDEFDDGLGDVVPAPQAAAVPVADHSPQ